MANKTFNGRVTMKHDTTVNWEKATNFVPLTGELIIYTDVNKMKIGDGVTNVNNLNFIDADVPEIAIQEATPDNSKTVWIDLSEDYHYYTEPKYLCFTAEEPNSTIQLTRQGSSGIQWEGSYSFDGRTWNTYSIVDSPTIDLPLVGDKVYFKGVYTVSKDKVYYYLQFIMSGKIAASGNVMSLCSGDDFENVTTVPTDAFSLLFKDCASLTTAPILPATTLAILCYYGMFQNCTSLTVAPKLPATNLAESCYRGMFGNCTSLTTAPELPATTLVNYCYWQMFYGCSSLTTIPKLPATNLAAGCYDTMFNKCSSLKISATQTDEYTIPYRIPTTDTGSSASGSLSSMFASTGGTFKGTPVINTTYYLSNTNSVI